MNLEMAETKELLEELERRFDVFVFTGIVNIKRNTWVMHCKGDIFTRIGLLDKVRSDFRAAVHKIGRMVPLLVATLYFWE